MGNSVAFWNISLDTDCPNCGEVFDLLEEYPDTMQQIVVGEQGTNHTTNVDVKCPYCKHEYCVDFVY